MKHQELEDQLLSTVEEIKPLRPRQSPPPWSDCMAFAAASVDAEVCEDTLGARFEAACLYQHAAVSGQSWLELKAAAESPAAEAPVAEVPAAEAPCGAPVVEAPVAESPVVESPIAEAPVAESPAVESPVAESPAAESPVAEPPVIEAPVVEAPVAEAVAAESPVIESPVDGSTTAEERGGLIERSRKHLSLTDQQIVMGYCKMFRLADFGELTQSQLQKAIERLDSMAKKAS